MEPGSEYDPAGQMLGQSVAPTTAEKVPAGQGKQTPAVLTVEYWPAAQFGVNDAGSNDGCAVGSDDGSSVGINDGNAVGGKYI